MSEPRVISRRDLLRSAGAVGAAAMTADRAGLDLEAAQAPAAVAAAAPAMPVPARPTSRYRGRGRHARGDRRATDSVGRAARVRSRRAPRTTSIARSPARCPASREAYRAGFAAFDRYCRSSRGKPFVELSPTDQDSVLIDVESGAATGSGAGFAGSSALFFNMVKNHTWQGTFGDPVLRRQRQFHRLGSRRLPRCPDDGHGRRPADARAQRAAGEPQVGLRLRRVQQGDGARAVARGEQAWRLGCQAPTSSWSAWARSAAWRCCRSRRRGSMSIGLEAGTVADPARLRARRDPQQRARLADGGAKGQSGSTDRAAQRVVSDHAAGEPSDDERASAARRCTTGRRAGA